MQHTQRAAAPPTVVRDGRRVHFEPVLADGAVLGFAAVVAADQPAGSDRLDLRDIDALRLALEAAAGRLGQQLIFVSVDLGGIQVVRWQLDQIVQAVLDSTVPAQRVVLQIGVKPACSSYVGRALGPLRRAGMQLAVHEVVPSGSCGCVGLVVELDWVKVHPCVLATLDRPATEAALRQVVECTRGLDAEVIATGVRSPDQAEQLRELGILVQQVPADDL